MPKVDAIVKVLVVEWEEWWSSINARAQSFTERMGLGMADVKFNN